MEFFGSAKENNDLQKFAFISIKALVIKLVILSCLIFKKVRKHNNLINCNLHWFGRTNCLFKLLFVLTYSKSKSGGYWHDKLQ